MIINTSYFLYEPLFIPNAKPIPDAGDGITVNNSLQACIDSMEYDLLVNVLGQAQYTLLVNSLNPDGTVKTETDERWRKLIEGDGLSWTGLRFNIGINKVSLIAYYVYYQFLFNSERYNSFTGLQRPRDANSTAVNANIELVRVWNKFVEMYQGGDRCYYNYWPEIFTEWNYYNYTESHVSLIDYLTANEDIYDCSFIKIYNIKNRLGL